MRSIKLTGLRMGSTVTLNGDMTRRMDILWADWMNLAVRWFHLIAGISWIGSSFYFMWLDSSLEAPEPPDDKVEGKLWMVHSGGFYKVEKRWIGPGEMPKMLHWFKWEATLTWISGAFLLGLVYYSTEGIYLLDPSRSSLSPTQGMWIGIAVLVGGWLVYDGLWQSPLGKFPRVATGVSLALLIGLIYGLCQILSGRGAFIHVGALLGTLMVANVWIRILPAQQQMILATKEGRKPDFELGKKAKRRSVHNSYVTFPVLFIMLSHHYPFTFGHEQNWLILILIFIIGMGIRHVMIVGLKKGALTFLPVIAALILAMRWTGVVREEVASPAEPVSFQTVHQIIQTRCLSCHSRQPSDATFGVAPGGVSFDHEEEIQKFASRIRVRVVQYKTMPLGNKTKMTDQERVLLGRWIEQGARREDP